MNWKTNLQLLDLEPGQSVEVCCTRCSYTRYELPLDLLKCDALKYSYLDEVEALLKCTQRGCHGAVRIALATDAETEGFMGGLA